ncbi:MAG: hypothetical protein ACRCUP_04170 [Mycoplasmatales bacterium]
MKTNKILLLTKIFLKTSFSGQMKNKKMAIIATIIGVIYFGGILGGFSIAGAITLFSTFSQPQQLATSYSLLITSYTLMIFFFALLMIPGVFYFSNDVKVLLPLPVKPSDILLAKVVTSFIYEFLIALFGILPVTILLGIFQGFTFSWAVTLVLAIFILPLLTIFFALFFIILIMSFTRFFANKERYNLFSGVIAIAIGALIISVGPVYTGTTLEEVYQGLSGYVSYFFFNVWLGKFAQGDYLSGLYFVIFAIGVTYLMVVFANKYYISTLIKTFDITGKNKKISQTTITKLSREKSHYKTFVQKEFKQLFRSSTYFINLCISPFIIPIFLGGSAFISLNNSAINGQSITELTSSIFTVIEAKYVIIGLFGAAIFISGISNVATTAITREGKDFNLLKVIPINYDNYLQAKLTPALILGYASILIIIIGVQIFVPLSLIDLSIAIVLTAATTLLINILELWIGAINPTLDWDSEIKAIKQNTVTLYGLLISFSALPISGLAIAAIIFLPEYIAFSIIIVLVLLASWWAWNGTKKQFIKLLEKTSV